MAGSDGGRRLTADGVRTLRSEHHQDDDAPLLLQVVGMHRCTSDASVSCSASTELASSASMRWNG